MARSHMPFKVFMGEARFMTQFTRTNSTLKMAMGVLQMRLSLCYKDDCRAMVIRAFQKLVLLFRMVHHLVFTGEYFLTVAFQTLIRAFGIVDGRYVSPEIAWFSERLLVRTTLMCANQRCDMDVCDVRA